MVVEAETACFALTRWNVIHTCDYKFYMWLSEFFQFTFNHDRAELIQGLYQHSLNTKQPWYLYRTWECITQKATWSTTTWYCMVDNVVRFIDITCCLFHK